MQNKFGYWILSGVDGNSYRAALVAQLAVAQQGLAVVNERIPLLVIQIFQFVYIILAFRLSFSYVDVRQNLLDYSNLCKSKEPQNYTKSRVILNFFSCCTGDNLQLFPGWLCLGDQGACV